MANSSGSNITTTMWSFAIGMVVLVFGAFTWFSNSYLTLREHQSFLDATNRDIRRLESEVNVLDNHFKDYVTKEVDQQEINALASRINRLRVDVERLQSQMVDKEILKAHAEMDSEHVRERGEEIRALRQRVEQLSDAISKLPKEQK